MTDKNQFDEKAMKDSCDREEFKSGHENTDEVTLLNREWGFVAGAEWQYAQSQAELEKLQSENEKLREFAKEVKNTDSNSPWHLIEHLKLRALETLGEVKGE